MRLRTIAMLCAVTVVTAATAAFAIENSGWSGGGVVLVTLKVPGKGALKGTGLFEGPLSVNSSSVEMLIPPVDLAFGDASTHTLTAFESIAADPIKFTSTTVTDNAVNSLALSTVQEVIGGFTSPMFGSPTGFQVFSNGPLPLTSADAGGLLVDSGNFSLKGKFTAIKKFTKVTGKQTIKFNGVLVGGPSNGKTFKGTIVIRYGGTRTF